MSNFSAPETSPEVQIPDFCLVVLAGAPGAGKSHFARRWFSPTEIVSSDHARALVSDDESHQAASADAFDVVRLIVEKRLKNRRLTVVDAANVRAADRRGWIDLARRWNCAAVAIVIDPGVETCLAHNAERTDRRVETDVVERTSALLQVDLRGSAEEGFAKFIPLRSPDEIEAFRLSRTPLAVDRRLDSDPFDIVGDVHGCADELKALLAKLGYLVTWEQGDDGQRPRIEARHGRRLIFLGDLVDCGPGAPDVLRLAMAAVAAGGYAVKGDGDSALAEGLAGADAASTAIRQMAAESASFRDQARDFLAARPSHLWLDAGALAVVHAGLYPEMIGRQSPSVEAFALRGGTPAATGKPPTLTPPDWVSKHRGTTVIAYGHMPTSKAVFCNHTIGLNLDCAFGGALAALRWPEREVVTVAATRTYCARAEP